MRPRVEQELFRSRLDQIIDMNHALVKLARAIDWRFLEETFGAVYTDKPGQPPLPTRLMAGLAILKHTYDLSDEVLCKRWVESPYFRYFCGEEFFQHALVFDRSSLTRWRQRMGEEKLKALLQESLAVATLRWPRQESPGLARGRNAVPLVSTLAASSCSAASVQPCAGRKPRCRSAADDCASACV